MNKLFLGQPTMQLVLRPGIIDLTWGHPDPHLLQVNALRDAAAEAFAQAGADLLGYGNERGPAALRGWLADRITTAEARTPTPAELMLTGGSSAALDQICTLLTQPGDVVFVESPTYHLAVRILRDHPLELRPIPVDADGMQVDRLAEELEQLRHGGRQARMLYTIPTFHNPTGTSLSSARRRRLIELARDHALLIVEDDVYRELAFDTQALPSLWALANGHGVIRLGSFAKSVAPGLRLGWMTGPAELIDRIAGSGVLDSGGGSNHFTAMIMATFCSAGHYDAQVEHLRSNYRMRRNALLAALGESLPPQVQVYAPGGGFFVWVTLATGSDSTALLPIAEAHGVAFLPGQRFHIDGRGRETLRLAYSLYPPDALREAARRLAAAVVQVM
ncbi:MAG TPA: PLP-dependent aminotransferase family protein [Roseiflexaceae bacterium]|nr:PLP-dependent aminotransferase family protein [Roseiflexaceae bacterium]